MKQDYDKRFYNRIEEYLSVFFLSVILILLTYQIMLRFIFNNANSWSEELSRYLYIWFVFMCSSYAVYKNAHIRIEAFLNIYPKKVQKYVIIIGWLIFLVYAVAITYYGTLFMKEMMRTSQVSLGLGVKMWYFFAAIPIGHAFMAIRCVQNLYKILRGRVV